jgi:uridylate kinase
VKAAYRRLLIKLSGGQLAGEKGFGINPTVIARTATQIREVHELGIQVCVVVGGGNIIRGIAAADEGMDRAIADYMGMMASVINALALQDALEKEGLDTRVQSAIEIKSVAEAYIRRRAIRHLEKGRVMGIDGVYDADPNTDPDAKRYARLTYEEALIKNLRVMDQTALALCRENQLPVVVFDMEVVGNLRKLAAGKAVGTRVED